MKLATRIASSFAFAAYVFALSGCSGNQVTPPGPQQGSASTPSETATDREGINSNKRTGVPELNRPDNAAHPNGYTIKVPDKHGAIKTTPGIVGS